MKKDYPVSHVCDIISFKEEKLFSRCLGLDFYEALKSDLVEYNGIQEYNGGLVYGVGAKVLLDSVIYISLAANNTDSPVEKASWDVVPKFNTDIYNELWVHYLRNYLAYMVIYTSINYSTYEAGAKGVTHFIGDETGKATVGQAAFFNFKSSLLDDAEDIKENMMRWISKNKGSFPEIEYDACGNSCKSNRRQRIAFRR